MPNDPKNPAVGEFVIDASEVSSYVKDHPPGAIRGLRHEQSGYADMQKEIKANQALHGLRAGVTETDVADLTLKTDRIAMIDRFLEPVRKLAEMLEESRAILDDERHRIVSAIAGTLDKRAKIKGNEDLLGLYERTRQYRSAAAEKAVRTRHRKKAAKAQ